MWSMVSVIMFKNFIWLALLAAIGCQTMDENLDKLESPYAAERLEAIDWLLENSRNPEENRKLLKKALKKDKSELVRAMAARFMALDGNEDFIPDLKWALQDPSAHVRMEVVQSLGSLKVESALPELLKMLSPKREPDCWVRLKVLKTVSYMKASSSAGDLVEALEDPESSVRFQALCLLEKFTGMKLGTEKEDWENYFKKIKQQS